MQELVELAQRGDRDAFAALASRVVDRLYAVAYGILRDGDRAHDAVQSGLLNAWRQLPTLRDPSRFDAWINRVVVSACYDEARQRKSWERSIRVIRSEPTEPDAAESLANHDQLERAFRRLSPEQRAVVVLHHYLGHELQEIAATLGIPVGTARSRLHYALRTLRSALEADSRTPVSRERIA